VKIYSPRPKQGWARKKSPVLIFFDLAVLFFGQKFPKKHQDFQKIHHFFLVFHILLSKGNFSNTDLEDFGSRSNPSISRCLVNFSKSRFTGFGFDSIFSESRDEARDGGFSDNREEARDEEVREERRDEVIWTISSLSDWLKF